MEDVQNAEIKELINLLRKISCYEDNYCDVIPKAVINSSVTSFVGLIKLTIDMIGKISNYPEHSEARWVVGRIWDARDVSYLVRNPAKASTEKWLLNDPVQRIKDLLLYESMYKEEKKKDKLIF